MRCDNPCCFSRSSLVPHRHTMHFTMAFRTQRLARTLDKLSTTDAAGEFENDICLRCLNFVTIATDNDSL